MHIQTHRHVYIVWTGLKVPKLKSSCHNIWSASDEFFYQWDRITSEQIEEVYGPQEVLWRKKKRYPFGYVPWVYIGHLMSFSIDPRTYIYIINRAVSSELPDSLSLSRHPSLSSIILGMSSRLHFGSAWSWDKWLCWSDNTGTSMSTSRLENVGSLVHNWFSTSALHLLFI